jgi:hypothetical protein
MLHSLSVAKTSWTMVAAGSGDIQGVLNQGIRAEHGLCGWQARSRSALLPATTAHQGIFFRTFLDSD